MLLSNLMTKKTPTRSVFNDLFLTINESTTDYTVALSSPMAEEKLMESASNDVAPTISKTT